VGWALKKTTNVDKRAHGRKVACSGQRTEKGAREVVCIVCRYAVEDRKGKKRVEEAQKGRLRIDGCPERTELVPI
jgi:hypothetical protein